MRCGIPQAPVCGEQMEACAKAQEDTIGETTEKTVICSAQKVTNKCNQSCTDHKNPIKPICSSKTNNPNKPRDLNSITANAPHILNSSNAYNTRNTPTKFNSAHNPNMQNKYMPLLPLLT